MLARASVNGVGETKSRSTLEHRLAHYVSSPLQFCSLTTRTKNGRLIRMKIYYSLLTFKANSLACRFQINTCKRWLKLSLVCLLIVSSGACSQSNREEQVRMQKEINELKEGQREIQEE